MHLTRVSPQMRPPLLRLLRDNLLFHLASMITSGAVGLIWKFSLRENELGMKSFVAVSLHSKYLPNFANALDLTLNLNLRARVRAHECFMPWAIIPRLFFCIIYESIVVQYSPYLLIVELDDIWIVWINHSSCRSRYNLTVLASLEEIVPPTE